MIDESRSGGCGSSRGGGVGGNTTATAEAAAAAAREQTQAHAAHDDRRVPSTRDPHLRFWSQFSSEPEPQAMKTSVRGSDRVSWHSCSSSLGLPPSRCSPLSREQRRRGASIEIGCSPPSPSPLLLPPSPSSSSSSSSLSPSRCRRQTESGRGILLSRVQLLTRTPLLASTLLLRHSSIKSIS